MLADDDLFKRAGSARANFQHVNARGQRRVQVEAVASGRCVVSFGEDRPPAEIGQPDMDFACLFGVVFDRKRAIVRIGVKAKPVL